MSKTEVFPNGIPTAQLRKHKWYVALGIVVLTFMLYGNTLSNGYSLDDELVIYNNERAEQGFKGIKRVWKENYAVSKKAKYEYRPIALTTFQIEYGLFGANPAVGHFISMLLYCLTGILLYFILLRIFKQYHWILPLTAVIIWLAHPLHTEVVASIKSRDEMLALLFALSSTSMFLRFAETNKWHWIPLGALMFVLSMLSKTSTLTFLALIPLTMYFFTKINIKKILIPTGAMFGLFLVARRLFWKPVVGVTNRDTLYFENPLFEMDWGILESIPMGFYTVAWYIKMHFAPYPLTFYYGYDMMDIVSWDSAIALACGLLVLGLTGFAIWGMFKKDKPVWAYGILFFMIAISMFANVLAPAVGIVAERFAYIASIGFAIAIAWVIVRLINKKISNADKFRSPGVYLVVMFVITGIFGGIVVTRNPVWKDHMTLYQNDIRHAGRSAKAHALIAGTLQPKALQEPNMVIKKNMVDTMIKHYKAAIDIYPGYYTMQNNLGSVYFTFYGDYAGAKPYFQNAIKYKEEYVEAHYNLGFSHEKLGKPDSAIIHYQRALEIDSNYNLTYPKLATALARQGRIDEAIEFNKVASKRFPQEPQFLINVGSLMTMQGDTLEALRYYEKGFYLAPSGHVANHIATVYKQYGNEEKFREYVQKAQQLFQQQGQ